MATSGIFFSSAVYNIYFSFVWFASPGELVVYAKNPANSVITVLFHIVKFIVKLVRN